jgi:2'-5' RNA ligase superfamily
VTESAFIVLVPEAEACVGELRKRFDAASHVGIPAHVTILVPFMPWAQITSAVLVQVQAALSEVRPFSFSMSKVGRFPATAYLAPEPAEPFIALTRTLVREFPGFRPFRGEHDSIVPHLTAANGNAFEAEVAAGELEATISAIGPVRGFCSAVSLFENSSGHWKEVHVFSLRGSAG